MTFRELQDSCLRELGYDPASLATEPRERVKDRLNHWHRRLLTRPVLSRFQRATYSTTLTTVANQAQYGLPMALEQVVDIRDETNDRLLPCVQLSAIRETDPGVTATGTPEVWAPLGQRAVFNQPSGTQQLWITSTSALDTMQATVEVITSYYEGLIEPYTVTLNGTTGVQVVTPIDNIREVTKFSLSMPAVGYVKLRTVNAAGTEIGSIHAGDTESTWQWVQLYPTPTSALTLQIDGVRRMRDLLRDGEEPLLPRDFHDVISLGALADEWRRKGDLERSALMRQDYEQRLRDLEWWVWNLPAYSPGGTSLDTPSRLGPWTPAGS